MVHFEVTPKALGTYAEGVGNLRRRRWLTPAQGWNEVTTLGSDRVIS